MTSTETDARREYIAGLRALADLLEQHDELPLPWQGSGAPMTFHFLYGGNEKDRLTAAIRAIGGKWTKDVRDGEYGDYFDATGKLRGLSIKLTAYRDAVCERVVKGTETVDVPAVEAQPSRTETREIVEWVCAPLLAEAVSS